MGRPSNNEDKYPFQIRRENLHLSRAQAAKLLDGISEDRLEGLENRRIATTPEDILQFTKQSRIVWSVMIPFLGLEDRCKMHLHQKSLSHDTT